ncbi:MAG: hypothetical protein FWD71_11990, partial [Oscillospiraceae bacterium]|nr:hypothetical protein [Oscillospiraceae bacterium]
MKFLKMKKILAVVISLLLILPVVPVMVVSATDTVYIDNSTDNAGSAINTYLSLLHQDVVITSGTNIESDEDIIIPADRTLTIEKDVTFDSGMGIDIWADGMLVIEKDAVLTIDNYINV